MYRLKDKFHFTNKLNDVLTIGELLVDMISKEYNDNFESNIYQRFFGGSPSNIAMNTKKLGINSTVAAAVGRDGFGTFLINSLVSNNINTSCIQLTDHPSSMVLLTKSKSTPAPIFYRGADYHLKYNSELQENLKNSKIVHFSCWPISKQPSRSTVEKIIEYAVENNILVCFDPNYHDMIWEKNEDGREYIKSILSKVQIVKPSEDDAERLFGKDTPENQIEKFLGLGVKLVIMTLGRQGAIVSNGTETKRFETKADEVIDTTGAGDAFWSGFYAAVINGYTVEQAVDLGLSVSAYKLRFTGAVVELPKLELINKYLASKEAL